ncbi:rnpa [Scardovia inopinata]|uniref:Ribonuclease P protein component n=1 Tax=Scardovia inopinata F0304 TaxID=641146 RepID=W5IHL0_SCAIO|nr:ribonuclease P protein component [Scardovia inopinata]EFG26472.1 ribonuclease P protein component [Scardovia inopinata F0304]BAR07511.1 ribonuclease P [Scardovia inopinata JCM 12537]SUV51585.1 rnpa [Scardovia inopinata]
MDRLKKHDDFLAVLKTRKKAVSKDLVVHYKISGQTGRLRLGLAVSKAVGHAVDRNKVKRRFRVLARRHENLLKIPLASDDSADSVDLCRFLSLDCVMRAKPSAAHVTFNQLDKQVEKLFLDINHTLSAESQLS